MSDETGQSGIGEVAPIERLSLEDPQIVPDVLQSLEEKLGTMSCPEGTDNILEFVSELVSSNYPSIRMGLETALLDLANGGHMTVFVKETSQIKIPINGLVWMGEEEFMREQIEEKLRSGFNCIKLKVGSLDFEVECDILKSLREISDELVIRLDANGGFQTNEVLAKLSRLAKYNIHSIEQPIMPLQPEAMELICQKSEIPIALDEDLIHVVSSREKLQLIQEIKPQFLVLKPSLHGGFGGVKEWIDLAEMHGIPWWITSYLESNIGLNAIAQFTSLFQTREHHGLGTGHLYYKNIPSPIRIENGYLSYEKSNVWGKP